jgi:hypothetical protein
MTPLDALRTADALRTLPVEDDVPSSTRERVFQRVMTGTSIPAARPAPPASPSPHGPTETPRIAAQGPSTVALSSGQLAGISLGSAVVGAALTLAVQASLLSPGVPATKIADPTAPVPTPSAEVAAPAAPEPEALPRIDELAPGVAPRTERTDVTGERMTSAQKRSSLKAERQLLDDARARAVSGDLDGAQRLIEAHRRQFTQGKLVEEREALTIALVAQSGDLAGARQLAAEFKSSYPNSFMQPAVDAAVARAH